MQKLGLDGQMDGQMGRQKREAKMQKIGVYCQKKASSDPFIAVFVQ